MSEIRLSGEYVEAIVASFGEVSPVFERKGRDIFKDNGISEIDAEEWYAMEKVAKATHVVENEVGEKASQQAGIKQVEYTEGFGGFDSIGDAIDAANGMLPDLYQNYSPDDVGEFHAESLAENRYRVSVYGPYPFADKFVKGILIGFASAAEGERPTNVEAAEKGPNESHAYIFEY